MKLKLFFISLFIIVLSFNISAQANLYKDIKSGMTVTEFIQHINNRADLSWNSSEREFVLTEIKGKQYLIFPVFNNKEQLNSLHFYCMNSYEWYDYEPNVKAIAVNLFSILKVSYSEPIFNEWVSWTSIPDGEIVPVCIFKKETVTAVIVVSESAEKYFAGLIISDSRYSEEVEASSEGF